jgi:hypothetical protein
MNEVLGLAFFVGIALFGLTSTVLASVWLWRFLRGHRMEVLPTVLIVAIASVFFFWGFWIVFDIGWLIAVAVKGLRRLGGPPTQALPGR